MRVSLQGANLLFPAMHLQPHPDCYLFDADGPAPVRLLTDDGDADPSLSATPPVIA